MAEILRHRRETRRQTDKANICLNDGKAPAYSPFTYLSAIHKEELMADWELAVAGEQPYKIDPLK
jgi:hypothetical protein